MMLPYTDFFKYLGMVCDKQINLNTVADATLCPCPAGTFRVKDFVRKHNLFNRLHMASQDTRTRYSGWYVCESDLSHSLLTYNKAKRWTVSFSNSCRHCWKGCWKSETPRLHGVSYVCVDWNPYSSIGFTRQCGCTILWLNPTATQRKRSSMLTRSWVHDRNDCWSAHILSAMDGLTQSYIFKQKFSLDYKGLQPGMAAQPIGPNK